MSRRINWHYIQRARAARMRSGVVATLLVLALVTSARSWARSVDEGRAESPVDDADQGDEDSAEKEAVDGSEVVQGEDEASNELETEGVDREGGTIAEQHEDEISETMGDQNPGLDFLVINVDPSIADGELYAGWIKERNRDLHERLSAALGTRQSVMVEIEGGTYDYRVAISMIQDEQPAPSKSVEFTCECSSEMLLDSIDEGLERFVEEVSQNDANAEGHRGGPSRTAKANEETQQAGEERRGSNRGLGGLGYAGLAVGIIGCGVLGGGVALALRPPYGFEYNEQDGTPYVRETRIPGLVMVAGGSAALVGGVVMMIVDTRKRRRSRLAFMPIFDAKRAGIELAGRF